MHTHPHTVAADTGSGATGATWSGCSPKARTGKPADAPGPAGLSVEVEDSTRGLSASALAWLRERAAAGVAEAVRGGAGGGAVGGHVRVAIVGDTRMAELHERHAGVPGTTDVLTFDLRPDGSGPLDTDIVVCFDEAERQAGARSIRPERELLLYIIHGALHCLGYDDHDEADALAMHRREDEILRAIGVGATFESADDPERRT